MTIHTTFPKGKRVHIIMKDGRHMTGTYIGKKSGCIIVALNDVPTKLAVSDIRSTSIER